MTQVREVLRAWLAGAGKRPAARRAGVDVKTAARYIRAAQAAGLARDGDESQLTDELLGQVVAAVRPARPAGHGVSWEALVAREAEVTGWVKAGLTLVKIGELLERSGTAVPYRTLARFAAEECGYSSSRPGVTVPVADGKPGEEVQLDFGYLGMIADGDRRRKLHALVFTAVLSRYCFVFLTFSQTTACGDRGLRGGVGVLRRHVHGADPGQPQAGGGQGRPAGAAVEPGVAGVRAGPRPGRGPGQGPLPAGQGAGRERREVRPGQLLRRGAVRGHRGRAAPRGGLVPEPGGDAGARHHPAAARGGVRADRGPGAAARARAAVPGPGVGGGQGPA